MTKLATRPTIGQHLNLVNDLFHQQWTVIAADITGVTLALNDIWDEYTEDLTWEQLADQQVASPAPKWFTDANGTLWQTTRDGRYRQWQAADRIWGPVEDADWVDEVLELTPLA